MLYSVYIVLILGFIIKFIALIQKIILTRLLNSTGISLYTYIMPTLGLFISISQFSLNLGITKYICKKIIKKPYSNRSVMIKSFIFSSILSLILIIILLIFSKYITNNLLKNLDLYYPLIAIIPLIPLTSYTGILKGYLSAFKKIKETQFSNLVEQITHFISMLILIYIFKNSLILMVFGAILSISIGEFSSLCYLLLMVKKITKLLPLKINKEKELIDVLTVSIPNTNIRLLGNLTYFLEPIIFQRALTSINFNIKNITLLYGYINGYSIPLLLMSSFIVLTISNISIPYISESISKKNNIKLFKNINLIFYITSYFALMSTILLLFYSYDFMNLLYKTTNGAKYVEYMAIPFIFYYFESPISTILNLLNKSNKLFIINFFINIIKLIGIYLLCKIPLLNAHGLTISFILSIIFTTLCYYSLLKNEINYKIKLKTFFYYLIFFIFLCFIKKLLVIFNFHFLIESLIFILLISLLMFKFYLKNKDKFI